jgi:hypothetical protein
MALPAARVLQAAGAYGTKNLQRFTTPWVVIASAGVYSDFLRVGGGPGNPGFLARRKDPSRESGNARGARGSRQLIVQPDYLYDCFSVSEGICYEENCLRVRALVRRDGLERDGRESGRLPKWSLLSNVWAMR